MFGLQATYELIGILENQFTQLQSVGLTADVAKFCFSPVSTRLAEMRTDAEFDRILLHTRAMPGVEDEPDAPASPKRAKKIPRWFEGADMVITERLTLGGATHVGDQDNSLKRHYFEAVDTMTRSCGERFQKEGMEVLCNFESVLISASNGVDVPVESVTFPFVESTALAINGTQRSCNNHKPLQCNH